VRQHHAFNEVYQLGGGAIFLPNKVPTHFDFCFRNVGHVRFGGPSVSDEQLKILREFPRVKRISLDHCAAITDRSVPLLKSFRHLESLDLRGTAISDEAADDLRQALPKCEVITHVGCRCGKCGEYFETRDVTGQTRLCPGCANRKS